MEWISLVICLLATWRVTHLLQAEDGPFDIIFRLRKLLGNSQLGKLTDCFFCLSLWTAIPFAFYLAADWKSGIIYWLALSGGAILLQQLFPEKNHEQ